MPVLTCITTTYNEGAMLMTSVRSLLAQEFEDFQLIIVDDGSGEETHRVLETLDDPRILVIRQANDGLSGARNKALEQAAGDYICFLDADDSRPGWAFATIARAIEAHAPDVLLCPGVLQEIRGEIVDFYDQPSFEAILALVPDGAIDRSHGAFASVRHLAQQIEPQSANKVISRAFLKRTGIGFPNTHFFEDIFFHTGVLAAADRIAFLDTPVFAYFRRYQRPQITATAGDLRFDSIAVSKLTLESFARRDEFHDAAYRAMVLRSCLRIVEWCENSISHHHRYNFHLAARAMIQLIDPLYRHMPERLPPETGDLGPTRRYLATLVAGG